MEASKEATFLEVQGRAIRSMQRAEKALHKAADEKLAMTAELERMRLLLVWLMQRHKYDQLPVPNRDLAILKESGFTTRVEDHEEKHVVFIDQKSTNLEDFKRELEVLGKQPGV